MAELHKLDNGMEVLLEENHAAPVISLHMLVKVGSAMEAKNEAGLCHLIEHMLFKGTPSRKVGAIAKDVEAAGGEINAYTSLDQTVFLINMASRFSGKGLSILADAICNPLFDKQELQHEKEVILEEIRRERDNPAHRNSELMFMNAYKRHPYKNPIIGRIETVKSFTRGQILDFYRRWYTPDNMTLIVVGQFKSAAMLNSIEKAFRSFKVQKPVHRKLPHEPASKGISIHLEENPIHATYFSMSFHIPEITHPDVPALDILSHILADTDSSRLQQEIREKKQLVNAVFSYAFTPKDPGLFIVGGLTSPEKTCKAITSIWDEIHKLYLSPIKNSELNRAKLIIKSHEIYEKETTGGQASKYAYFMATAGTHLFDQEYYRALQDVRVGDVRRAVQKYLTPENLTLVAVHPKGSQNIINTPAIKNHIERLRPTRQSVKKVESHVSPPVVSKLSNGIRLVLRENHTLPIVSCCAAVHGGLRFENKANNGINNLLALVISKGTKTKTAVQIAERIESIAGSIDGFSGRNTFGLRSEFLSDKFDEGFDLFAEVLTQPSFTPSEISKEKLQVLDAIKNQEDALSTLAFIKFLAALFPHHPYGLKVLGEKNSVKKIGRKQLLNYYQRMITPANMVVSVVGDISPDEVVTAAENKLALPGRKAPKLSAPKPEAPSEKAVTVEYRRPEKKQAHIVMGFLGPRIDSKDHYAVAVLNNILSGQGGRLFLKLRDRMSLAYAIGSTYFAGLEPGYIAVYMGTDPSKLTIATSGIKKELELLVKKGVSAEELSRSKNHLIGSYELEKQRNLNLAGGYAFNLLYGLGIKEVEEYPKKINAVSPAGILDAARKYLRLDAPVTAIVKPV